MLNWNISDTQLEIEMSSIEIVLMFNWNNIQFKLKWYFTKIQNDIQLKLKRQSTEIELIINWNRTVIKFKWQLVEIEMTVNLN